MTFQQQIQKIQNIEKAEKRNTEENSKRGTPRHRWLIYSDIFCEKYGQRSLEEQERFQYYLCILNWQWNTNPTKLQHNTNLSDDNDYYVNNNIVVVKLCKICHY